MHGDNSGKERPDEPESKQLVTLVWAGPVPPHTVAVEKEVEPSRAQCCWREREAIPQEELNGNADNSEMIIWPTREESVPP